MQKVYTKSAYKLNP